MPKVVLSREQLTPHFRRLEFECPCGCGFDDVSLELVNTLESFRNLLNNMFPYRDIRIHINSGCRCPAYNKKISGVPNSLHLTGHAADIRVYSHKVHKNIFPDIIAIYAESVPNFKRGGIGLYTFFVHLDVRYLVGRRRSRWSPTRKGFWGKNKPDKYEVIRKHRNELYPNTVTV